MENKFDFDKIRYVSQMCVGVDRYDYLGVKANTDISPHGDRRYLEYQIRQQTSKELASFIMEEKWVPKITEEDVHTTFRTELFVFTPEELESFVEYVKRPKIVIRPDACVAVVCSYDRFIDWLKDVPEEFRHIFVHVCRLRDVKGRRFTHFHVPLSVMDVNDSWELTQEVKLNLI